MLQLEIKNISKSYGKKVVLKNINLTLGTGVYGLLGPNGAGKTTLISIIVNILKSDSGEVCFEGEPIKKLGSSYFKNIGYLPQYPNFYKNYTAQEFLEYIAVIKGIKGKKAKARIDELFEFVNLQEDRKKKVGAYSGGMRQRLGIAQALLNNPKLLILDEPTAGLDPKERIRFRNLISRVSENKTVILATHIVQDIESIAREVVLINNGRVICNDTPENLINTVSDKVWQFEVPHSKIEDCLAQHIISNVQFTNNGFSVKAVGDKPNDSACPACATLEEVYLYYVSESGDGK
jgi:ABC-2 type transport system ATP-binding protein